MRFFSTGMRLFLLISLTVTLAWVPAYGMNQLPAGEMDVYDFSGKQQSEVEDEKMKIFKMKIYSFAGVEMLQLRELADELGWALDYVPGKKETIIRKDNFSLSLRGIGSLSMDIWDMVEGEAAGEDAPLLIKEGRTYLSLRRAGEFLEQMGEEILVAGFYTDRSSYKKDDKITAHMRLYNFTSESIRLNFGSGQRYDLYLLQDDEEIWRWSDDKFFTMALVFKELEPGEGLSYDLDLEFQPDTGEYILGGELATIPERIKLGGAFITFED